MYANIASTSVFLNLGVANHHPRNISTPHKFFAQQFFTPVDPFLLTVLNTAMKPYLLPFIVDAPSFLLGCVFGACFATVFWLVIKLIRAL